MVTISDINKIEEKYFDLINEAKSIMNKITDPEHSWGHVLDVVDFCKQILLSYKNKKVNAEALILSCYWHDVGRTITNDGHEQLSADLLCDKLKQFNYNNKFILTCYNAIIFHKWNMKPKTIEGIILRDADKLAFLGINRWTNCLKQNYKLTSIVNLLPQLKNKILCLNISKTIYDKAIIELNTLLFNFYFEKTKNSNN